MGLRTVLVAAMAVAACAGRPLEPELPDAGVVTLQLGTVAADGQTFAALIDGQDAMLTSGAQGGFHVWMKFRAEGMRPSHLQVSRTAHRLTDGALVLRSSGEVDLGPANADGYWELPTASPMFMCPSPIGLQVSDEPIVFEITLSDDAGRSLAHGAITLVPRCPAAQKEFCERICTG